MPLHSGTALSRWRLVVAAVAAAHLVLGLALAGRASFWGDEAFTAETVRLPLRDLGSMLTRIDINMAAYYVAAKGWSTVFGTGELALRSLSLLCSTATVVIAAGLVTRWFGARAGAVTAIALGLNPFFLLLGLTARSFAMLALVTTVAMGAFVAALRSSRLPPWLAVAAVDVLALYTSLLAALTILAQAVVVVVVVRRVGLVQLAAAVTVAVGAVPALIFLAPKDTLDWLPAATPRYLLTVAWQSTGRVAGAVLGVAVIAGLLTRPAMRAQLVDGLQRTRWILPVFVIAPMLVMFLLLPVQSLFYPPYLIVVLVPATMLAGAAVGSMKDPWPIVGLVAITAAAIVGLVTGPARTPTFSVQDWRGTIRLLNARVRPGDVVTFPNTFYRVAGEHYGRGGHGLDVGRPALPAWPWFSRPPDSYDALKRTGAFANPAVVRAEVDGAGAVWLVGPDDSWMDDFSAVLSAAGWRLTDQTTLAGLVVRHFVGAGGGG